MKCAKLLPTISKLCLGIWLPQVVVAQTEPPPCNFDCTPRSVQRHVFLDCLPAGMEGCTINWGDGTIENTCYSKGHRYASGGQKTIVITSTSGPGGCRGGTLTKLVNVFQPPPCEVRIGGQADAANRLRFNLVSNITAGDYEGCRIDWGDGTIENICTPASHTYAHGGTYIIKFSVTDGPKDCSFVESATSIPISCSPSVIDKLPSSPAFARASGTTRLEVTTCAGCTYEWKKDGVAAALASTSHVAEVNGPGVYRVKAKDPCNRFSNEVVFNLAGCPVNPFEITGKPDGGWLCPDTTALLTVSSGWDNYQWKLDNLIIANGPNNQQGISKPGKYSIIASMGCGSKATKSLVLKRVGIQSGDLPVIAPLPLPKQRVPTYNENFSTAVFTPISQPIAINSPAFGSIAALNVKAMTDSGKTGVFPLNVIPVLLGPGVEDRLRALATGTLEFTDFTNVTYIWKKDGERIQGAHSATLLLPKALAGVYSVEVVFPCGKITTNSVSISR